MAFKKLKREDEQVPEGIDTPELQQDAASPSAGGGIETDSDSGLPQDTDNQIQNDDTDWQQQWREILEPGNDALFQQWMEDLRKKYEQDAEPAAEQQPTEPPQQEQEQDHDHEQNHGNENKPVPDHETAKEHINEADKTSLPAVMNNESARELLPPEDGDNESADHVASHWNDDDVYTYWDYHEPGELDALPNPESANQSSDLTIHVETDTRFSPDATQFDDGFAQDPDDQMREADAWYQQWKNELHQTLGDRPDRDPPNAGAPAVGGTQGLLAAMVAAGAGRLRTRARERTRRHDLSAVSEAMHGFVDSARALDRSTRAFERTAGGEVAARLRSIMDAKGCGLRDAMGIVMKDPRHTDLRQKLADAFQDPVTRNAYRRMAESMDHFRQAGDHMSETLSKTAHTSGWKPDAAASRLKDFVNAHEERVGERLRGVPPLEQESNSLRQRLMEMASSMRGNFANIIQMLTAMFRPSGPDPDGPRMEP
jgi:hypothetical protein